MKAANGIRPTGDGGRLVDCPAAGVTDDLLQDHRGITAGGGKNAIASGTFLLRNQRRDQFLSQRVGQAGQRTQDHTDFAIAAVRADLPRQGGQKTLPIGADSELLVAGQMLKQGRSVFAG